VVGNGLGRPFCEHLEGRGLIGRRLQEDGVKLHLVAAEGSAIAAYICPLVGKDQKVRIVNGPRDPAADEAWASGKQFKYIARLGDTSIE
jgi:hypothetical protein